jgi:hypothetical protein
MYTSGAATLSSHYQPLVNFTTEVSRPSVCAIVSCYQNTTKMKIVAFHTKQRHLFDPEHQAVLSAVAGNRWYGQC